MNDLDRMIAEFAAQMDRMIVAMDRNSALLERSVAADEQMAALTGALLPGAAPEPVDVAALEWRNGPDGGFTIVDRDTWVDVNVAERPLPRRPATEEEAAAIRASIKPTTRRGR